MVMTSGSLKFKISTALKNIIGRDLINDRFIAVFELVKNSYDAGATSVNITINTTSDENRTIIIDDNGRGMSFSDIENKWLFVAYSEKRKNNTQYDYRDKIKRKVAGAKGVGRFSCDRLGSILTMITKTSDDINATKVLIDWNRFEIDDKQEFMEISVKYDKIMSNDVSGTKLIISNLREKWERSDFQTLKKSLMKLINPESDFSNDKFEICLYVDSEINADKKEKYDRDKVNGIIKNDIIEKLNIKTTSISVTISENGDYITTDLYDRGEFIFEYKEKNNKFTLLKDMKFLVLYLNKSAKINFTSLMGVEAVNYGSIFVYKNGFRIYPYGEFGRDEFGIDRRKAQGRNRFLGTRDLMGRIQIIGDNDQFNETTSRDGGFINNSAVEQLSDFFISRVLRTLEKYVVDVIDWGDPIDGSDNEDRVLKPEDVIDKIIEQFTSFARRSEIIDFRYNPNIIKYIDDKRENSITGSLTKLFKIAKRSSNEALLDLTNRVEQDTKKLIKQKEEAEKEIQFIQKELVVAKDENIIRKQQNFFLQNIAEKNSKFLTNGMHSLFTYSEASKASIEDLHIELRKLGREVEDKCIGFLSEIAMNNLKMNKISEYAIKGNFELKPDVKKDIRDFISQYVNIQNNRRIKFIIESDMKKDFICVFDTSSIGIIIDNIVSNSLKAHATSIVINIADDEKSIMVSFTDNGQGLSENYNDVNILFELGATTTKGFGIGLYHIKELVEEMSGTIEINKEISNGFMLIMRIKK